MENHKFIEKVADFLSGLSFLFCITTFISIYVMWNIFGPYKFDPFPFLGMNTGISIIALYTPIIILFVDKMRHAQKENQKIEDDLILKDISKKLDLLLIDKEMNKNKDLFEFIRETIVDEKEEV